MDKTSLPYHSPSQAFHPSVSVSSAMLNVLYTRHVYLAGWAHVVQATYSIGLMRIIWAAGNPLMHFSWLAVL